MSIGDEKYVALTTYTGNGGQKVTPVWIAEVDDHLGVITAPDAWKLRRLRNDPRCAGILITLDGGTESADNPTDHQ